MRGRKSPVERHAGQGAPLLPASLLRFALIHLGYPQRTRKRGFMSTTSNRTYIMANQCSELRSMSSLVFPYRSSLSYSRVSRGVW